MNRLSVVGLEENRDKVLKKLQELGVVQIDDPTEKLLDDEWAGLVRRDGDDDRLSRIEARMASVEQAIDAVTRFANTPDKGGGLFASREKLSRSEYEDKVSNEVRSSLRVKEVISTWDKWNDFQTQLNTIESQLASLVPWSSYELPLDLEHTDHVRVFVGTLPVTSDAEAVRREIAQVSDASDFEIVSADQDQIYVSAMCMSEDEDAVLEVLKAHGFGFAVFKNMFGTAQQNTENLKEDAKFAREEQKKLEEKLASYGKFKDDLRYYYDNLSIRRERAIARNRLLRTDTAFTFDGWFPEESGAAVRKVLDSAGCEYEIRPPEKDEETPVLLRNNSFVLPLESITEMYALPRSTELDPTPFFTIFYIIFFGMMFADIGYGILLFLLTFIILKKSKPEGSAFKLLKTLMYCGISTAIWGVLFGGFFGNLISVVSRTFFGHEIALKPLWIDPLKEPMFLLAVSCIFGVIHLFVGMGLKAYMQIKDGNMFGAVQDVFAWYLFIIGAGLALFGGDIFGPAAGKVGIVLLIIGAVLIVGCQAIAGKGVGKLRGLYDLYGCTSYLSDILSYSRLLALGLASAVIAQVFNEFGALFGRGFIGAIAFIIVAMIGHVMNFAINALGSFVHTSRLQYVEFFGKFYEGGGVAFDPLTQKTKYIKIVEEDK